MSHSKLDLHGNLLVTTFQLPSGLDFSTVTLMAILIQNKVYYEYNSSGIVSQPSSAENAIVKTCDVEGTVSSIATECVMTITPLPWYICPCHENLWREYHDPNSPLPTMVEMSVELPYDLQHFTAGLQESFKKYVSDTAQVDSFRVEQLTVTAMQGAAVNVTFSLQTPQDTEESLNLVRVGKAEKMRAALSIEARLLENGVRALNVVLKEAVVVPPACTFKCPAGSICRKVNAAKCCREPVN
jgi:hypothetical protein